MKSDRITAAEYRSAPKAKANKFNAEPTIVDGIRFASKKEANRYIELRLLEKAGKISHLVCQPRFDFMINGRPVVSRSERYPNGRQLYWKGDFAYFDGQKRIVEDVKGVRTKEYKLKKAIVEAMHPAVRVREV